MAIDSIPARILTHVEIRPHAPAYFVRGNEGWIPTSWRDYWNEITTAARALTALGVTSGDRTCILSFNRPEWAIADVATMAVGAVPAGIYTTSSPKKVHYIADHCEAEVIFVENKEQWNKVEQVRDDLPALKTVVVFDGGESIDDPLVLSWNAFYDKASEVDTEEVTKALDSLEASDPATFIYTSGTTGPPKAVILTHRNLTFTSNVAKDLVSASPTDRLISYLPLSHIAEQMFTIHGSATMGYSVYYAESIDDLKDNLLEVSPTIFFGVPRIWEKLHAGIQKQLQEASGLKAALIHWVQNIGRRISQLRCKGEEPSGLLKLQYALAQKIALNKLHAAIGLGEARICVSGAAPLSTDVMNFFLNLDIVIHEVYGQSEDCGPTSFNFPGDVKIGSVGKPVPGVEVRIADDGEILVKGDNVFKGYYKNPEETNKTLVDGWLHSGDFGEFQEGFLHIIGRKKEILITAGGKNVAPKNLEAALKRSSLINEAVVIGDERKFLSALLTLDADAAQDWADEHDANTDQLHQNTQLLQTIQEHIDDINTEFSRVETIKKFRVLERNFTIDDEELTPTLKIKRRNIYRNFDDVIESIYADV